MSQPQSPAYFDPLSTEGLTNIICRRFETVHRWELKEDLPPFGGHGLYALYFVGAGGVYAPLSGTKVPLYVGQSVDVRSRLREHRRSINSSPLAVSNFAVGALLMPEVHVDLGEDGLRKGYLPIWNELLKGFGSHGQGHDRGNPPSRWDTFHPGRYAAAQPSNHDVQALHKQVTDEVARQSKLVPPWQVFFG
ncbi:Eco29kI family restriction endonuclease [Mycobacteroides abscessus]|uniref:Eco29kI family restriction endonuclease n=1 Tax=Mycobacteroides abscessus TaxID=36809 RepID=UPI000C26AA01|nr:Eco29kI family restriction endonuclease [Mycobacteroides abscessus]